MATRAKNIFIPVLITLGILILLEIASRIILSKVYNRHFDSSLVQENKYGTTSGLKPNATGTVWGKAFHTDEMGGRKHAKSKSGKPKLLLIGDSVTEGVGVDDSSTFANLIHDKDDTTDVRNISMIGWSVTDYRNAVDSILATQHDISGIFLFYCLNDIYGKTAIAALPAMANKDWGGINKVLQDHYATYKLLKLIIYQHSGKYYKYDEALYRDPVRVKNMLADINHIHQACAQRGVEFVLFVLPYRSQFQNKAPNIPQQILINALATKGILAVDLMTLMEIPAHPADLYLFADEIHLSPKGHKAIADVFGSK